MRGYSLGSPQEGCALKGENMPDPIRPPGKEEIARRRLEMQHRRLRTQIICLIIGALVAAALIAVYVVLLPGHS
jgi:hypothetical protein